MTWSDIAKEYAHLAAPILAPALAALVASLIYPLLKLKRNSKKYANMIRDMIESRLTEGVGAKSTAIMEHWNDIATEANHEPLVSSQSYMSSYFATRLRDTVDLTYEETEHVKAVLNWLNGGSVAGLSDERYVVPKLPRKCGC